MVKFIAFSFLTFIFIVCKKKCVRIQFQLSKSLTSITVKSIISKVFKK